MLEQIPVFITSLTQYIPQNLLCRTDHVHYRTHSNHEYDELLTSLIQAGHTNLGEEEISGRIIATIELSKPIAGISHLEISQPKPDQTKFDLQQLGVVIDSFDDLDTDSLDLKDGNPLYPRYHQTIVIDEKEYEIKYATKTLAQVTHEEQSK